MERSELRRNTIKVWIFAAAILALSLYIHLTSYGKNNSIARYAVVAAGFLYSLTNIVNIKKRRGIIICLAFVFMLAADWFLVIVDGNYVLAVCLFSLAQLTFAFYLLPDDRKKAVFFTAVRFAASGLAVIAAALIFKGAFDLLTGTAAFYFANQLINAVCAGIKGRLTLLIGVIFLAACDIFIGLGFLGLYAGNIDFIWLFYPPSVFFIALSVTA